EVSTLRGKSADDAQIEIQHLLEQIQENRQKIFGDSSERRPRLEQKPQEPKKPQCGHGPRPQPLLPVAERTIELKEEARDCGVCGGYLEEMKGQAEESEEITVIERRFALVKYKRKKYRCRCNANVVTAPAPVKLRPGNRYSLDFAVEVACEKYLEHNPLDRQCRKMHREGLNVDPQTVWDQLNCAADILEPIYEALDKRVMQSPLIFVDETWWRLMGKRNKEKRKWWVWGQCGPDAVFYRIRDNRSKKTAREILSDYAGIVMVDGYGVYKSHAKDDVLFRLVHCWAHVRRKFVKAELHYPESTVVLDLIGDLYDVESDLPIWNPLHPEAEQQECLLERKRIRKERSSSIVDGIKDWAIAQRPLPGSSLGKAISYMFKLWSGLTSFLKDPRIPLDNNAAERSLRGIVLGRKNHYGSRSKRGTEVAALFYSLLESAKLCGVDPKAYLRTALYESIKNPGTVILPSDLL
ncbi:MAG: IS66 family transposase, partial [Candidatus Eisenbacteria bacterium]|nr:IS66 family transposase [Candidatus Eisenbacteria bacterium]